jgi:hypothetical protein
MAEENDNGSVLSGQSSWGDTSNIHDPDTKNLQRGEQHHPITHNLKQSRAQPRRDEFQQDLASSTSRPDDGLIFLKDATRRKLAFPFKIAKTWHVSVSPVLVLGLGIS